MMSKYWLVMSIFVLNGCFSSPSYWLVNMEREFRSIKGAPEEAIQGMIDGCKSTLDKRKYSSAIRMSGGFYMNPELSSLAIYRRAFSNANYYCAMKWGHSTLKPFTKDYGGFAYMGTGGDYIHYSKDFK